VQIERTRDRERLRAFLERDPGWAAYALGDLEPGNFERSDWFMSDAALCMVFHGLTPPVLFCMGAPAGVAAILESVDVSPAFLLIRREHLAAAATCYETGALLPMWRMVLPPDRFRHVNGPVVRLTMAHLDEVQRVYGSAFGGDAFAAYQLHDGIYYGIFEAGRLVSVAGTHVIGWTLGAAAVGNVATLPDYRNRGYAKAVTSAVCAELLHHGIKLIALNVNKVNAPAVRAYTRLGFDVACDFLEGAATRSAVPARRQP